MLEQFTSTWFKKFVRLNKRFRFSIIVLIPLLIVSLITPFTPYPAYANDSPTLIAPLNGSTITATGYDDSISYPPVAVPEFHWQSVADAKSYRLRLCQDVGCTLGQTIEFTTSNTRFSPWDITKLKEGEWFWQVRVDSPTASAYSEAWSFIKNWASPDNLPQLLSPVDGGALEFFEAPFFNWQPVIGAARYRIQIASSQEFTDVKVDVYTLKTTYQPTSKLANGTYYWRVVPYDAVDNGGTYSPTRSFIMSYNQVPQLLEPANNSFPTFTPTFHWTAVRGAQFYRLEYSTDPTFNSGVNRIDTKNTSYTPTKSLPNDVNHYWRVQAHSGSSISDWSPVWKFKKQWYILPVLLTPVKGYQYQRFPLFSWTPVPGASYYKIEINTINSFPSPTSALTSNTFYTPQTYNGSKGYRYWRVTPFDRDNNAGKPSDVSSYYSSLDFSAPAQVFPLYYYRPNNFPSPDEMVSMHPYEDRTIALPIFIWHRVTKPYPEGGVFADAYRIQVSDDPTFLTVDWSEDTENLVAAPILTNPFTPSQNVDYFWRVCPLESSRLECVTSPDDGQPLWSQIWRTRVDLTRGLSPTQGESPQLLRPTHASEFVETTPLLEWWPLTNAITYSVQISMDENFAELNILDEAVVNYPAYAPEVSLAQRSLGKTGFGSFYWRVRAFNSSGPIGPWSSTWRFQIAAQSHWLRIRSLGNINNRLEVGTDPSGDAISSGYDITNLNVAQSADYWFFGFNANPVSDSALYGLYLDLDHTDDSGAPNDPRSLTASTIKAHQPEYAIYISRDETPFTLTSDQVFIYPWERTGWGTPQSLVSIGGDIFPNTLRSVYMSSSYHATTVGNYGDILDWNGSQWASQFDPSPKNLYGIKGKESCSTRWAVGQSGMILGYDYTAGGWEIQPSPTSNQLNSVEVVSATLSVAVGDFGTILHWNGTNWSQITSPTPQSLNAVALIHGHPDWGWIVGNNGTILRWTYNSINRKWEWQPSSSPTSMDLYAVSTDAEDSAWAVGEGGVVLHWDGSFWTSSYPAFSDLFSVAAIANNDAWAIGKSGVILHWNGSNWNTVSSPTNRTLYGIYMNSATNGIIVGEKGVNLHYNGSAWSVIQDPIANYIEIMVPNTTIGHQQETGSYAVSLFTANPEVSNQLLDTVPTDPNIPGSGFISRFASVTERLTLAAPPTNATGDTITFPSILPFFWDFPIGYLDYLPVGIFSTSPWAGATMKAYTDPGFTTEAATFDLVSDGVYYSPTSHAWPTDFQGDNSYFWRVRPRYLDSIGAYLGAWSQSWRFERRGFVPQNLQESVTFATPTFSWDKVEGAEGYILQVDNDPEFGTKEIDVLTSQNSFTPEVTLPNGTFYWRVRVRRNGTIIGEWSATRTFNLTLPQPTNLTPNDPLEENVVGYAPTFCWDPLLVSSNSVPVLAAWKYRVQVSKDNLSFSPIYDTIDTEQNCWTPIKGYENGKYYWHVAMIDGQGRLGDFSPAAVFTKQYPITTLVSPLNESTPTTPTFIWTPVDGAAAYRLEVSLYPTFTPLYEQVTTHTVRYTPIKIYQSPQLYYWRVAIIDKNGKLGPFNDATIILDPDAGKKKVFMPFMSRH